MNRALRGGGAQGSPQATQMVEMLNGLAARDALCLLVGCMLTVLDEAPSDEECQQSLVRPTKDRS
jgi:hypothetical protein